MSRARRKSPGAKPAPRARTTNSRQRQRLIEACISALHEFGPSRTTVEKVVAIAKMSPGIVRFYFDSKAAMLVASLQFLAAEFEERLLVPVARLEDRPVAALELLVDLYLDPDLASPRKVAVWYAFWGEASSRQEYYDICGQKDERFAQLVRRLIERLIAETRQSQLDADAIALGLIGVLEILWQGFAFQTEVTIDRAAAKHRCMAYLRSVFPGEFAPGRVPETSAGGAADSRPLPRWSYADPALHAEERRTLFDGAWQLVGARADLTAPGAFLAADLGTQRALLVRDAAGIVRAFRDSCPVTPHRLAVRERGVFADRIECRVHGLQFGWDGLSLGNGAVGSLAGMDLQTFADLLFVRASGTEPPTALDRGWFGSSVRTAAESPPVEGIDVAADWKVIVEQWLSALPDGTERDLKSPWEHAQLEVGAPATRPWTWSARLTRSPATWSAARYLRVANIGADASASGPRWQRVLLPPNQLIECRPDGLSIWQVLPSGAGRSRVRRFDFPFGATPRESRALRRLAARITPVLQTAALAHAESVQQGLVAFGYEPSGQGVPLRAQAAFRVWLRQRIPALRRERAATARGNSL